MSFDRAIRVADAVLLEGYVLYPYRATAPKNRFRFPFGVLAPKGWSEDGGCEPWWMETQLLLEPGKEWSVDGRLRFLHLRSRTVEAKGPHGYVKADRLEAGESLVLPWDEGELREIDFCLDRIGTRTFPIELAAGWEESVVADPGGAVVGRIQRRRASIRGVIETELTEAEPNLLRLRVRVENLTAGIGGDREAALPSSLLSAHLLFRSNEGSFLSLLDPPPHAREAAKACTSVRAHPVLAGPPGDTGLVLAAPFILYDHPQVAPESPGDFFDACEIDELLALRTATLTDEEKRQARATDPRAAALVDRIERLPNEKMERLHGALRDLGGTEMIPRTNNRYAPGTRVRLLEPKRRTDAQDALFVGCSATIEKVEEDVDGNTWIAVTIDDDPAAELYRWYGRFHYYAPDEVELL